MRLFAALREAAGTAEDEIEADNVEQLIEEAKRRYGPRFSESLGYSNVAVNGTLVSHLEGQETRLLPTDVVAFLPPVSGGRASDRIGR